MSTSGQVDYSQLSLDKLTLEIRKDWKNVNFAAEPYLRAMRGLELGSNYGHDSAESIVRYFLANAGTWRGTIARAIKKELNTRLKNHNQRR